MQFNTFEEVNTMQKLPIKKNLSNWIDKIQHIFISFLINGILHY